MSGRRGRPRRDNIERLNQERKWKEEEEMREAKRLEQPEYILERLKVRGEISESMFDAGVHYAMLYGKALGKTAPSGDGNETPPEIKEAHEIENKRKWREASDVLMGVSRAVKDAVENASVFGREQPRKLDKIKAGLSALDELFHQGERMVA